METTVKSVEVPDEDKVKGSQDDVETGLLISVNRSRKSHSSCSSTSSRVSLEAARARAKAEAAKARYLERRKIFITPCFQHSPPIKTALGRVKPNRRSTGEQCFICQALALTVGS
ncbi:hypothetical protein MHYP_G00045020 [Metynnis hypsauchen]